MDKISKVAFIMVIIVMVAGFLINNENSLNKEYRWMKEEADRIEREGIGEIFTDVTEDTRGGWYFTYREFDTDSIWTVYSGVPIED